uniref:NADH-ubiquinone oxidoreductase chain 2 n=1 Tax=Amphioplus laevis TaxID=2806440 RepID=A0A888VGE5_9ECHI|nr:NADH dehydrogenase subunit 2 [Amphioplus laevis]QRC36789.1 NADH dehydrogenase subunit 2 [Amphioplus laevis]
MLVNVFYNLSLILSIFIVLSAQSWIFVWSSIELVTILLIILISQEITPRSVEGVSKYFIAQAVASSFLILGIILRYYFSGEMDVFSGYNGLPFYLILVGLFVKIAVFPNPFWFVDSISGLKLIYSFYIIILSKVVPLYLYINLCEGINSFLILVGVGSVIFGSVLGLNQTNVRKIIALSSISHLGWLVLGLPYFSFKMSLLIFGGYILMLLPLLWVLSLYNISDFNDLKRGRLSPISLSIIIISLLSLGGFPPLLGFFYKWFIFSVLLKSSFYLVCGGLIFGGLISLFFYLRLCYNLYCLYWPESKVIILGSFIKTQESMLVMALIIVGAVVSVLFLVMGPLTSLV